MSRQRSNSTTQLRDLKNWIRSNSVRAHGIASHDEAGPPQFFIPNGTVERHFEENNYQIVRDLLYAIFEPEGVDGATRIRSLHSTTVALHCCRIFCILVLLGKPSLIVDFIPNKSVWDNRLPFDPDEKPRKFPSVLEDAQFYTKFVQEQWKFCAETLQRASTVKFDEVRILPFVSFENIGGGNSSTVYSARVHKEHNKLSEHAREGACYAIKSFRAPNAEAAYQRESTAFGNLTRPGAVNKVGLIEYFGGFEYKNTFNIILEYADGGNLEQYLQTQEQPRSVHDAIDFWTSVFQVLKGLSRIHEHYWDSGDAEDGISQHGHSITADQVEPTDRHRNGTRTYGAPETYAHNYSTGPPKNRLKHSIDIWSLGAIYSEAAVWSVMGNDGVNAYHGQRRAATSLLPNFHVDDCFHDGTKRLAVVDVQHDRVLRDHDLNSSDESLIRRVARRTWDDLIRNMMDARPMHRHSATVLSEDADELLQEVREFVRLAGHASPTTQSTSSRSPNSRYPSEHHRIDSGGPAPVFANMAPLYQSPRSTVNLRDGEWPPSPERDAGFTRRSQPVTPPAGPSNPRFHDRHRTFPPTYGGPSHRADNPDPQPAPVHEEWMDVLCANQGLGLDNSPSPNGVVSPSRTAGVNHGAHPPIDSPQRHNVPDSGSIPFRCSVVPHLSLQELQEWHVKAKADKRAKLPKDQYLMDDLDGRDHVFMIDDSEGMKPHKNALKQLVQLLVYVTKTKDPDGVDLYFLSSNKLHKVKHSSDALRLLGKPFSGQCSINGRLGDEIHKYCKDIDMHARLTVAPRKRSIYILTDGALRHGDDFQGHDRIKSLVSKLVSARMGREQIGIQFIRFGNDQQGIDRLDRLDNLSQSANLGLDIVDTEPADGNVWKMLHGAINAKFDGDARSTTTT
ncbi:hypothetical protein LTR17_011772 [Elasticomyces elasticus]|nr:hypothetical protein LTR17_011772 [Elasticomyces elasticus]